jgi:hypothetical protein
MSNKRKLSPPKSQDVSERTANFLGFLVIAKMLRNAIWQNATDEGSGVPRSNRSVFAGGSGAILISFRIHVEIC